MATRITLLQAHARLRAPGIASRSAQTPPGQRLAGLALAIALLVIPRRNKTPWLCSIHHRRSRARAGHAHLADDRADDSSALFSSRLLYSATGAKFVLPPHETVLRAFDKQATTRLAASLGIAMPQTTPISDRKDARRVAKPTLSSGTKARSSEEVSQSRKVTATGAPLMRATPQSL